MIALTLKGNLDELLKLILNKSFDFSFVYLGEIWVFTQKVI